MQINPLKPVILIIFFICFSLRAQENFLPELSSSEITMIKERKLVLKTKDVPGSPWPEITFYAFVEASPLESMGIFSALDYQKNYVPNILVSKPIKHISPVEVHTEYEMHVPFPFSNAKYVHGSIVKAKKDIYELEWYKVESTSTESVKGAATFIPFEGKTLFRYRSYIVPKSAMAKLVKSFMLKDVEKSIVAIRDHIEKLKKEQSPLLAKYSEFINRALNGENVYQK